MSKINIEGIDKGVLLAELFNRSQPMGMGWLQAHRGPEVMTHEQGREIIIRTLNDNFGDDSTMMFGHRNKKKLYFDYLFGRPLKVDLTEDEVDPWGFDRDNGGDGTFQSIVDKLRAGETNERADTTFSG